MELALGIVIGVGGVVGYGYLLIVFAPDYAIRKLQGFIDMARKG